MNRISFIIAAALVLPLAATAGDLVKTSSESTRAAPSDKRRVYVPPKLVPLQEGTRTQSGATRNARAPTELRVLAPEHTGFTVSAQPTVYWYTSKPIQAPVEIVIETADGALAPPIVDQRLKPPFKAGLHAVSLADLGVTLETGREYAWRIVVVVDEKRRANDVYAGANIARVDMPDKARRAAMEDCRSMLDGQSLQDVTCPGTKAL
jgi:hypothetical protein